MRIRALRLADWLKARLALLGLGCILLLVFALYLPTLDDLFHGDDYIAFVDFKTKDFQSYSDDVIRFEDSNYYWRPLGKIFHRILFEAAGLDPFVFRLAGVAVFLATLVALYAFCRRERLNQAVSLGAALIFGVLPNHVVSVAFVTNTSRLMAVLFFLLCLLLLQHRGRLRGLFEVGAWLLFMAAVLSDETALALAPLPVLYSIFLGEPRHRWLLLAPRAVAYALLVLVLVPMQFENTLDDEERLAFYGFGPHMVTQAWALVSQLVLPLTRPEPWDVLLSSIKPVQWSAGLVAIGLGAALFVAGSMRLRFLLLWTAFALAPFTLWGVLYTSPRYVYMAAVPYSVVLAWIAVEAFTLLRSVTLPLMKSRLFVPASGAVAALVVALAVFPSASTLLARNELWSNETARYGVLARELRQEAPNVSNGSRIVLFYDDLSESWARATIWAVYGDKSLIVQVVPEHQLDVQYGPYTDKDFVFYRVGDQLLPSTIHGARR